MEERRLMGDDGGEFRSAIEDMTAKGIINEGDVRTLHEAGIDSLTMLTKKKLSHIDGLPKATFKAIRSFLITRPVVQSRMKTVNTIGRKDLQQTLMRKRKRIEELKTSVALNSASKGQIKHWKTELESCERKVRNIEMQFYPGGQNQ